MEGRAAASLPPTPGSNSTQSFWLWHENAPTRVTTTSATSTAPLPERADLVIIGCGLTGASTAYFLSQHEAYCKNKTILVLDARGISEGATGRNGGHCWASVQLPSEDEVATYGVEDMKRAQQFKFDCAAEMKAFIEEHKVDCNFAETGALNVARFAVELEEMKEGLAETTVRGFAMGNMSTIEADKARQLLSSSRAHGATFYPLAGQFWPAKIAHYLIAQAQERGVMLRTHVAVERIERSDTSEVKLHTTKGTVRASTVVYATNGYTSGLLPELAEHIKPVRGQVICTRPLPALFPHSLSLNDGYEYLIQRKTDGRVVFGGFRWRSEDPAKELGNFDDSKLDPTISSSLREFLSEFFDGSFTSSEASDGAKHRVDVEFEWSGVMGFTADSKPFIGPYRDNEYLAVGFNGNGMCRCFKAGKTVVAMITGEICPSAWIQTFLPSRIPQLKRDESGKFSGFVSTGE